jgi:hypothetical protein
MQPSGCIYNARRGQTLRELCADMDAPIGEISERWINQYDRGRVTALADLKRALEEHPVDKPSFVCGA